MLLGSPSLKCFGFNFRCTATDITATLAGSMALSACADDDACVGPAANATTGGACNCPLAMTFRTWCSCWHRSTSEFEQHRGKTLARLHLWPSQRKPFDHQAAKVEANDQAKKSGFTGVASTSTLMLHAGRLRFLGSHSLSHFVPLCSKLVPHKAV